MSVTIINVSIPCTHILAIRHFMAKDDIRYYLNGFLIEGFGSEIRLVATTGHFLGLIRMPNQSVPEPFQIIVPYHIAQMVKPTASQKKQCIEVEFEIQITREKGKADKVECVLDNFGVRTNFVPVDGIFPPYRKVFGFDYKGQGAPAIFDVDLLGLVQKSVKDYFYTSNPLGCWHLQYGPKETDAAIIRTNDKNFIGLVMPLRIGKEAEREVDLQWIQKD